MSGWCVRFYPGHRTPRKSLIYVSTYRVQIALPAALRLACVASVSNRVTARKLEREQKGEGSFIPLPLPRPFFFFLLSSQQFSTNSRGNACYAGYPEIALSTHNSETSSSVVL